MSVFRLAMVCLLLCGVADGANAATIYKCSDRHGQVAYQDAPCAHSLEQQVVPMVSEPTTNAPPPPAVADTVPTVPPPVVPALPRPAPPVLFGCVRATDGKAYVSPNGQPPAYLAPLGMIDAFQSPLADVYGAGSGGGASAPEISHAKVTANLVANHFTWVQDRCRPLSPREACEALRDENDANEEKLRHAFKSDQAPLEQRATSLRQQMAGC